MITYFTEQDLVSFGSYILSNDRREAYVKQGISEDKIYELLKNITVLDLTSWVDYLQRQKQTLEPNESTSN